MAVNTIVLSGRLVGDCDLKLVNEKLSVVSFTLAVDRGYKGKDGKKETDFIPVVAYNKDKLADYLVKGKQVCVVGSLQIDKYEKDGQKKTYAKVVANQIELLGSKKEEGFIPPGFSALDDSDIPF